MEFKIKDRGFAAFLLACALAVLLFSYFIFGITGVRIVLGIIFVSLPFYFMLNNFDLEHGEKFVFSLVLGITIFPSLVYALGFILSFRISIVVVFIFLLIAAFIMSKFKKK
ncbi:MAG TPA: hypothetical protein VJJ52_00335 [Candidatus Nanoarchaeia archaeon]|nr:hypothetical protein [Candidatus Nanoarchaeia archaeon]